MSPPNGAGRPEGRPTRSAPKQIKGQDSTTAEVSLRLEALERVLAHALVASPPFSGVDVAAEHALRLSTIARLHLSAVAS